MPNDKIDVIGRHFLALGQPFLTLGLGTWLMPSIHKVLGSILEKSNVVVGAVV